MKSLSYESFHDRSCDVASRRIRLLAVLVPATLVLLATGCATRSSLNRLHVNVATMQRELNDLRQAHEAMARDVALAKAENRTLQAKAAELAAALAESRTEVATLRLRVDAAEADIRATKASVVPAPTPAALPPVTSPPAPVPALPLAPRITSMPAPRVAPSARGTPPPAPMRPRETPGRTPGAEQTYQAALSTFRAREHGQAVLDFLDFIAKHPGHPLVANAQYWIGEAYYVQRDYRQAIAEFHKVPEIAPGSAKASDALLKIGLCQRHLRDEAHARQTWQRVVRDFPRSEAAVKARAFLTSEAGTARR